MFPVIFHVGDFPIHSYGFFMALGFIFSIGLVRIESKRLHLSVSRVVDLGFYSLLVGMLGARILYVITRWNELFSEHPIEIFYLWEGGLVFYGAPLICIPFILWYSKKFSLSRLLMLDLGALVLPMAHLFGRIGCFSVGCCHGRPTDVFWGVKFNGPLVDDSLRGVVLHPTQLYEAGLLFFLFLILFFKRKNKKFEGELAYLYLLFYSLIRFFVEFFRGDSIRGFVLGDWLSTSQFISLLIFVFLIATKKWILRWASRSSAHV